MTPLQKLELKVLELHGSLSLRPTLESAAKIGEYLTEAKDLVPHGQFIPWVKRCGISHRTAVDYMAVFREGANTRPAAHLSLRSRPKVDVMQR